MMGYGNRGMTFESLIEHANRRYRLDGIAIIEKQHTLCKPLRNGSGKIVSAKYEEKATVDFMGRYGTAPIAFEAKHCSTDRIDLKRVEEHQCQFLREWAIQGIIGFVIVSFRLELFYLIPWDYWQAALDARQDRKGAAVAFEPMWTEWQTTGKASIRADELPDEWIEEVVDACRQAPQHRYLFLTKNPNRLCDMANSGKLPRDKNFWWGSTLDNKGAKRYPGRITDNTFLSIEPLTEYMDVGLGSFGRAKWIIIGAENGNRKDKVIPRKEWIDNICEAAALTQAAVFMKDSLIPIVGEDSMRREFPWKIGE